MYCKNCGKEMNNGASICLECGAAKNSGSKFCAHCGKPLTENAKVCIKCGYSTKLSPEATVNDKEIFCTNCGKTMKAMQEICLSCGAKNDSGRKFCRACGAEVAEGAQICVKCGCVPFSGGSGISMDKLKDGIKNLGNIKDELTGFDIASITEHKYFKFYGLAVSVLIFLSYLFPFFNVNASLFGASVSQSMNGFTSIFGIEGQMINIVMLLPLLFVALQVVAQFLPALEKYKSLANLVSGVGCFLTLIIAAIVEAGLSPTSMVTITPGFGFFFAAIVSLALAGFEVFLYIRKR